MSSIEKENLTMNQLNILKKGMIRMLTLMLFCCVTIGVASFNWIAYTSFEQTPPAFIDAALIGAIMIMAVIITMCVKSMFSGGFTISIALITLALFLFPLAAGRLYMLSDWLIVTIIYYILHWAWIILYTILGLVPAILYYIFHAIFSMTPMAEDTAYYAALAIAGIAGLVDGIMVGEGIVDKFACFATMPDATIVDSEGEIKDVFFHK